MSNDNATERLRELLDERGVEWWPMHDAEVGYHDNRDTEFLVYGCKHVAHEWGCRLQVDMLTPEQAIAATLGNDGLERSKNGVEVTCVPEDYTAKLMAEFTRVLEERDTLNAKFEVAQSMRHAEYEQYTKENAKLRAQLAEWKRVAESKQDIIDHMRDANAENAKLRELLVDTLTHPQEYCDKYSIAYCDNVAAWVAMDDDMNRRMAKLGIEVGE